MRSVEPSERRQDYLRLLPRHGGLHRRNHGRERVSHVLWVAAGFLEAVGRALLLPARSVTREAAVKKDTQKWVGLGRRTLARVLREGAAF